MRTTLSQAKASQSGIARSINIAACDARFPDYVNNAQQRLSEMGKWWGTYRRIYACLSSACITWPREVACVEGFRVCQEGIVLLNEWYEFGEAVKWPPDFDSGTPRILERPNACQYLDTSSAATFRIYPTVAGDAGTKVILQGLDTNGAPVRTQVSGSYIEGEQVTLASPFATSSFQFSAPGLLGVQKPVTKGRLNVYAVDSDTGVETKVAFWEPSEVNPTYRRSYIDNMPTLTNGGCSTTGDGCGQMPTDCSGVVGEAIVRMEFVPATVDTDWLFISNIQAIAAGCRALLNEERNNQQEALVEWENAKRILRNELEKYSPAGLTRINAKPHGSAHPRRLFAGFR